LQDQVAVPREVPERWRNVVAGERAFVNGTLSEAVGSDTVSFELEGVDWLWRVPMLRETTFNAYRDMEAVGGEGLTGLAERAQVWARTWDDPTERRQVFSINYLYLPAVEGYAR